MGEGARVDERTARQTGWCFLFKGRVVSVQGHRDTALDSEGPGVEFQPCFLYLLLTSRLIKLSNPQCIHLQNGNNPTQILWGITEIIDAKSLVRARDT